MQIEIIKNLGWQNVYLKLINHNRKSKLQKLPFENKKAIVDIDLDKYQYIAFTDKRMHQTEIIILSENLSQIELKYNRKIKKYVANLYVKDISNYGLVETFILTDDKNLSYKEHHFKTINILKPNNYDENKKYGMLIMFDSQNIFDKKKVGNYTKLNDPYGGWQVEASLSQIKKLYPHEEYIVVGIECADRYREYELSPGNSFGNLNGNIDLNDDFISIGYLDMLDDFINETLIPFIKKNYSIDETRLGISGSSAGGTACHYVGLKNFQKYRFILCFTPASGLFEDMAWNNFYEKLDLKNNINNLPFFYYYQGKKGWLEKLLYQGNINLVESLISNGYPNEKLCIYIEPKAEHNEISWRYGFNYGLLQAIKYFNK